MIESLTILQLLFALILLKREPLNPASIIAVLTPIFFVFPAILFYQYGEAISYSWRNFAQFSDVLATSSSNQYLLTLAVLISFTFTIGASVASRMTYKPAVNSSGFLTLVGYDRVSKNKITLVYIGLFSIWSVGAIYQLRMANYSLTEFLLPIVDRDGERVPGYIKLMYTAIPPALYALSLWKSRKITALGIFSILLCFVSVFSTHQRREAVTMILYIFALPIFLDRNLFAKARITIEECLDIRRDSAKKVRLGAAFIFLCGLTLVPLLWYLRVDLTAASEGKTSFSAMEHRSFWDVMFGSPATGFPTFIVIAQYAEIVGFNPFYLVEFVFSSPIPRAWWPSKPTDLDTVLQNFFAMMENPSSFWIGEIYYVTGVFSLLFAAVAGFVIYRAQFVLMNSLSLIHRTLGAVLFMQSVTLFKNGFAVTAVNLIFIGGVLMISWKLINTGEKLKGGSV